MPFTKENASTLQAKGVESRKKRTEDLWAFVASGGARQYHEKLQMLSEKEELTKPEQEFMDRVEKLFPYVRARKTDVTSDGKEINQVLVKFIDEPKDDNNS